MSQKEIVFALISVLFLSSCTLGENLQSSPQPTVLKKEAVKETSYKKVQPTKVNNPKTTIFYDPNVAAYIFQNQGVKVLKAAAPEFAYKILSPHCSVEKFIAGLNSSETKVVKTSPSSIVVTTKNNKLGDGNIIIKAKGANAEISSAVIGKFRRTEAVVLSQFAKNICNKVDEKFK